MSDDMQNSIMYQPTSNADDSLLPFVHHDGLATEAKNSYYTYTDDLYHQYETYYDEDDWSDDTAEYLDDLLYYMDDVENDMQQANLQAGQAAMQWTDLQGPLDPWFAEASDIPLLLPQGAINPLFMIEDDTHLAEAERATMSMVQAVEEAANAMVDTAMQQVDELVDLIDMQQQQINSLLEAQARSSAQVAAATAGMGYAANVVVSSTPSARYQNKAAVMMTNMDGQTIMPIGAEDSTINYVFAGMDDEMNIDGDYMPAGSSGSLFVDADGYVNYHSIILLLLSMCCMCTLIVFVQSWIQLRDALAAAEEAELECDTHESYEELVTPLIDDDIRGTHHCKTALGQVVVAAHHAEEGGEVVTYHNLLFQQAAHVSPR